MQIIRTHTPDSDAGRALSDMLLKYTSTPVLLLVSGGSAVAVIEHCDTTLLGDHVTLGLIDERFSKDPQARNSTELATTEFFIDAVKYGAHVLDISIHDEESAPLVADRWEAQLSGWIGWNPGGRIFAVLGIGEDGHTAGIMPGMNDVDFSGSRLVLSYTVPKEVNIYTDRITTTFTFLKTYVDEALVYAVGRKKQNAIDSILTDDADLSKTPAAIFKQMKSVTLFTDTQSSS